MRRMAIAAAVGGVGVWAARALAPELHQRFATRCKRMLEQMPDDFPPKRTMRSIEEIRRNTALILETLGHPEQPANGPGPDGAAPSTDAVGHAT